MMDFWKGKVTGSVAVSPKAGLISVPLRKVFGG
jgi:hypothetical protein